jgi:hypothetical protein
MNKHGRIRKEAGLGKMKAMEPANEQRARTGKEKIQDAVREQERQEEGREKQYAERILTYSDDHNPAARKRFDESRLQIDFERRSDGANVFRIDSTIVKCHNLIYIALHCRCSQ